MNRDSARPRRLRVSALAAVANPSYTRIDTWNLLDDACRHLAEVDLRRAGHHPRRGQGEAADGPPQCLRAVLAVSRGGESGDLPRSPRQPFHGAARRGGVAGGAPAVRIWRPHSAFRHCPRRWPIRSWWPKPNNSSSTPCCSPTTRRPRLPTAWPKACARCATRPTMCSSNSWSCPASRTPSPRSR